MHFLIVKKSFLIIELKSLFAMPTISKAACEGSTKYCNDPRKNTYNLSMYNRTEVIYKIYINCRLCISNVLQHI